MRAFITGGSGFVGRYLIEMLRQRGDGVAALARSAAAANVVEKLGAEAVAGDLDDVGAMTQGMRGCNVVFHSGAFVKAWGDPRLFHRVNVQGTENALEAARSAGAARFVHVSTEAVLAGGNLNGVDESTPYPAYPVGLYPRTKALAEQRVRAANTSDLATIVVRPRFIWGKGDTSLMPQIVAAAKKGVLMWFNGGNYRCTTTHVANVCEGLVLAAERGRGGEVYFVTDGEPLTFREFITRLLETQGIPAPTRSAPRWVGHISAGACEALWSILPLPGEPPITRTAMSLMSSDVVISDAKARRELGYLGIKSYDEGFNEMKA